MAHEVMLPECVGKFKTIDAHLEETPKNREMIVRHDEQIIVLTKDAEESKKVIAKIFDKMDLTTKEIRRTITRSALSLVVAITLAILWTGRYIEKVERLDQLHPAKVQTNGGQND
jgi:glycerol-3-phosphate cytidylyltransferase-like family protein